MKCLLKLNVFSQISAGRVPESTHEVILSSPFHRCETEAQRCEGTDPGS